MPRKKKKKKKSPIQRGSRGNVKDVEQERNRNKKEDVDTISFSDPHGACDVTGK